MGRYEVWVGQWLYSGHNDRDEAIRQARNVATSGIGIGATVEPHEVQVWQVFGNRPAERLNWREQVGVTARNGKWAPRYATYGNERAA